MLFAAHQLASLSIAELGNDHSMTNTIKSFVRTNCIGCGCEGSIIYSGLSDRLFGAPGIWGTRKCSNTNCGMAWLDPLPETAEIHKLYQAYWTHGHPGTVPAANPEISSLGKRQLRRFLRYVLPWRRYALQSDSRYLEGMKPGRLLDVGCGMGEFAAGMAKLGWDAYGIDFDAAAISVAERQTGLKVEVGSLAEQNYPSESFDAITMSNVIEHVPDPVETFDECFRVLRKGGRLVIITPNINSSGHNIYGKNWRGLEVPRHLYLFSIQSLKHFARKAGFFEYQAFTSAGAVQSMLSSSIEIANKNGEIADANVVLSANLEKIAVMMGRQCGEWAVLVADK